jgi:multiple sugar transport system permease protein
MTADRTFSVSAGRRLTAFLAGNAGKLALVVVGMQMLAPFWWAAATSLVPSARAFDLPPNWIPTSVHTDNYKQVFQLIPFLHQVFNSLKITTIIVVGSLLISSLAAFAFARLRFPGREVVFIIFLTALMVPSQVTLIPNYILMRYLGLLDTHIALWLPALIQVFSIFMLRQHFMSLPPDIEEAARIDGAGNLRILFRIYLPMSAPVLSALAIFTATNYWNDFITPNTYLSTQSKFTVPVGIVSLNVQFGASPTTVIFAAVTMVSIPLLVLFLFTQRRLTEGVSLAGVSR